MKPGRRKPSSVSASRNHSVRVACNSAARCPRTILLMCLVCHFVCQRIGAHFWGLDMDQVKDWARAVLFQRMHHDRTERALVTLRQGGAMGMDRRHPGYPPPFKKAVRMPPRPKVNHRTGMHTRAACFELSHSHMTVGSHFPQSQCGPRHHSPRWIRDRGCPTFLTTPTEN
jgi:hypothetical protein